MYLIDITIKADKLVADQADQLLNQHRAWFQKHFEAGDFLLVGPYKDRGLAGLVIAQAASREAVEQIISEDAYYPNGADYRIHEFQANLISDQLADFRGS